MPAAVPATAAGAVIDAAPPAAAPPPRANAVRAVRVRLEGTLPAERAALLVRDDRDPFALVGRWAGVAAIVGSEPLRTAQPADDPLALLDQLPPVEGAPAGFVGGGWFGMLGYGLGRRVEPTVGAPPPATAPERLPDAVLAFYDHVLRRDGDGAWWFEALWSDARANELEARRELLAARLRTGGAPSRPVRMSPWRAAPSAAGHARAVAACQRRIAEGDLFQANLALRLRAELDGEAADLFTRGVEALRPDRAAWLAGGWGAIASLSPELLVARDGRAVLSAPIKGTRPRPADEADAAAQRAALASSAKDRAENVMIVDLVRNDLGRVCEPGSVRVSALAEVRPHAGVWHLVSEVEGRLRDGVGDAQLVAALFPPGSVTGAPKVAAMDVVSELESNARQAFCGAIGFASPTAGLELSVAIRTFELRDGRAWLDVGGGVVADSDPDAEAAECLAKAAPLLAAVGGELAGDEAASGGGARPVGAAVPEPRRTHPRPDSRPDPDQGIFESILVQDGLAIAAGRHLERMAASAQELYGVTLPPSLGPLVDHTALEQGGPSRLRVLLDPDGAVALDVAPVPEPATALALAPVVLPGGLGAHKWRDRRLVDAFDAETAPALPLLVDLDGLVLETTRSTVFAIAGDTLVTPPLDGRILPGITRARILEAAAHLGVQTAERPLPLAELQAADAAFTVNALRRVEPVAAIGDATLAAGHELARALAAALAERRA